MIEKNLVRCLKVSKKCQYIIIIKKSDIFSITNKQASFLGHDVPPDGP